MLAIYRREMGAFFTSGVAYVFLAVFWLVSGIFFYNGVVASGTTDTSSMFSSMFYIVLFLIPVLTMKLLSEEKKNRTDQGLLTAPVGLWEIVLGKYFAAWTLVLIGLLPCFVHYFVVAYMAEPMGNLDSGAFIGSFIGLIMLSGTFMAIGLLCATFSKSQIVCFISGALSCFVLFWALLQDHYSSISRGVIDLRDVAVFITVSAVAIIAAIILIDHLTRK